MIVFITCPAWITATLPCFLEQLVMMDSIVQIINQSASSIMQVVLKIVHKNNNLFYVSISDCDIVSAAILRHETHFSGFFIHLPCLPCWFLAIANRCRNCITPNSLTHARKAMALHEDQVIYIYHVSASTRNCFLFWNLSTKHRYSNQHTCYI